MDIEIELNGEATALLVRAIYALEEDCVKIVRAPRWVYEILDAMTGEQGIRAAAQLFAATHNPYRDGPITMHVWRSVAGGFASRLRYGYGEAVADVPAYRRTGRASQDGVEHSVHESLSRCVRGPHR